MKNLKKISFKIKDGTVKIPQTQQSTPKLKRKSKNQNEKNQIKIIKLK